MQEQNERVQFLASGTYGQRKIRGAVPHDLGTPGEDPWIASNAYNIQDTCHWKGDCHYLFTNSVNDLLNCQDA